MSFRIYRKTVYRMLNLEIFESPVVLWIILMKYRDSSAVASNVDAAQARIKLDHIRLICHREVRDGSVLIKVEHGH